MNFLLLIF